MFGDDAKFNASDGWKCKLCKRHRIRDGSGSFCKRHRIRNIAMQDEKLSADKGGVLNHS